MVVLVWLTIGDQYLSLYIIYVSQAVKEIECNGTKRNISSKTSRNSESSRCMFHLLAFFC